MRPVTYVADTFPTLSQTFTRAEVRGLVREGLSLRVASLHRPLPRDPPLEPSLDPEVIYLPSPFSGAALGALMRTAMRRPARLLPLLGWCARPHTTPWRPGFQLRAPVHLAWACWLAESLTEADHVHAPFLGSASNVAWMASRLAGASFSFTAHSEMTFVLLQPKLRDACVATSVSEFERARLLAAAPKVEPAKLVVSRLGIDLGAWPVMPARSDRALLRVLAVGMLGRTKGHDVLLEAAALLNAGGLALQVDVVGEGPERPRLEAIVRERRLQGIAKLHGPLPQDDVRRLTQDCDVAVLACRATPDGDFDGIPVALMEAMATGRPVVSTRLAGIPELVRDGETGLLVTPERPDLVADALRRLAEDPPLRARLGLAGRRAVEDGFDASTAWARMAGILRERVP